MESLSQTLMYRSRQRVESGSDFIPIDEFTCLTSSSMVVVEEEEDFDEIDGF
jgi:hypothetical protein